MIISVSLLWFVSVLLLIIYFINAEETKTKAVDTAGMLIDQVETIIEQNKEKRESLVISLKEDYTVRAKNISYILDNRPQIERNLTELTKIAKLNKVDEIHIFDVNGKIYSGTAPKYYGYSMESGEQMAYFKPMLLDKNKEMCQDMMPNTAENKLMMYAMCWNERGTRLTQVGIEPHRLMQELKANNIHDLVMAIPSYRGITIIVADQSTGEIKGSTSPELVGRELGSIGVDVNPVQADEIVLQDGTVNGHKSYYSSHGDGEYYVTIVQQKNVLNESSYYGLKIIGAYLLLVITLSALIINVLFKRARKEYKNATTDIMTGLLNRRGYEIALSTYGGAKLPGNFNYVSIDLNGLKGVNDTLGHAAGDELIKAAAACIRESFGKYGETFRVGGDEFAAIVHGDKALLEHIEAVFKEKCQSWQGNFVKGVSAACGYVQAGEFPDISLTEIIELADKRMYFAKKHYYDEL